MVNKLSVKARKAILLSQIECRRLNYSNIGPEHILVGIFENLGAAYISPSHKDIYAFLLLILVLIFRPSGLFGVIAKVKA